MPSNPTRQAQERAALVAMAKGLEDYVVYHGGIHDDDCPGDDTCECEYKRLNDGANQACRYLAALAASETSEPQTSSLCSGCGAEFIGGFGADVDRCIYCGVPAPAPVGEPRKCLNRAGAYICQREAGHAGSHAVADEPCGALSDVTSWENEPPPEGASPS
jgi:hypothetical protein